MDINIDALEAAARAASFGADCVPGLSPMQAIEPGSLWYAVGMSDSTLVYAVTGPAGDEQSAIDATFIAAANPAVVLALIERLRGIDKLLNIIGAAYQIAGTHDCPEHVLDVLCDPEAATQEQVDALLPYVISGQTITVDTFTVNGQPITQDDIVSSTQFTLPGGGAQ
jgi:hypothetical protein